MAKSFSFLSIPDLIILKEGLELASIKHIAARKHAEGDVELSVSKAFLDSYQMKIDRIHELKLVVETEIFNLQTGE